jgi:hypothetical protein
MQALRPVLLDFFDRSPPDSTIGQTAAIHFALVPLLYEPPGDSIYHPTLVGPDSFPKTGGVL